MPNLVELSDLLFSGEHATADRHPFAPTGEICEVADGVAAISSFANVAAIDSGDGLVLVDTGGPLAGDSIRTQLRTWRTDPIDSAVYTHGHIDHVLGTKVFDDEATTNGAPAIRVLAHRDLNLRLDRYCLTAGYNAAINQRQFSAPGLQWPVDYRRPDTEFEQRIDLRIGELAIELHHARGETDDHTWVWVPEKKTLCTGDLFIWCVPNAGNPQKVQRYARDWAIALHKMAALSPEVLLPGHGVPILGRDRVHAALTDTANLLDSLVNQTLALMNQGAFLDEILHTVRVPDELSTQPYLQPIYDEPEFIVRNIWRLYGGWYDGNPSHLKPAPEAQLAATVAELSGGANALADRAEQAAADGDHRLAGHLIEWASLAAPDDAAIHRVRAALLQQRADQETSLMAKGIYRAAANESVAAAP